MDYDKLDKLIDHALRYETDDYLLNLNLKPDVSDKLLTYQYRHVFNLIASMRNNNVILDGSDTGTGKTYTAIALCKQLRLKPIIVCPKSIMSNWNDVCKYFNVKPVAIVNYETIKLGKQYDNYGKRVDSNIIYVDEKNIDNKKINPFTWTPPRFSIVIFDEVHKCKNQNALNGKLLMAAKELKNVLMLSATISDKPENFGVFGYMLGFYNKMKKSKAWINGMLREDKYSFGMGLNTGIKSKTNDGKSCISKSIYPDKGSRIRISELGDKFPDNQISAVCYKLDVEVEKEIEELFGNIQIETLKLKTLTPNILVPGQTSSSKTSNNKREHNNILADITKMRIKIENSKVPIFVDLIKNYHENNFSVVVFVNYVSTLKKLAKKFKTTSVVYGNQTSIKRDKIIYDFQKNRTTLIICTIETASVGINLHDINGRQRVSLISPTFKSIDLIQALGRIHRVGSKSPAIQRIIYCANTCEETICNRVKSKLNFLSKLNDNDMVTIN
jgi:superfamily II DNA or RNA helicase